MPDVTRFRRAAALTPLAANHGLSGRACAALLILLALIGPTAPRQADAQPQDQSQEQSQDQPQARPLPAADHPLMRYLAEPDAAFGWTEVRQEPLGGATVAELLLTSQTWQGFDWQHQLFLIRPARLTQPHQALLMIDGGSWPSTARPTGSDRLPGLLTPLALAAEQLGSPIAVLRQVPHQPLLGGLREDALIAETFVRYQRGEGENWPLLWPMVKSAVRGMDAVQAHAQSTWDLEIRHFTLIGASKRGWTTWLTAAVDERVNALAPMVIDLLNLAPQMRHQIASFGAPSEQIHDYTDRGLFRPDELDAHQALIQRIDPYHYRAFLTQPKLILLGTNDRFWPLDALNLYWDALEGEKHVLYIPNAGHSLGELPRVLGAVMALHDQAAGGATIEPLQWSFSEAEDHLALTLSASAPPQRVRLWQAQAPTRDFREARWQATELLTGPEGTFDYRLPRPGAGWAAMFAEVIHAQPARPGMPLHRTTTLQMIQATTTP